MRRVGQLVCSLLLGSFVVMSPPPVVRSQGVAGAPAPVPPPAAGPAGELRQFIACPIYRDTDMGRKSGCWLASDAADSTRFDVTWAPIKPQIGKPVLVEGVVAQDTDTCGGVVLNPVRVSVIEGRCPKTLIAADQWPGRPSPPPTAVLAPASEPRTLPPPPYDQRDFSIYFEFGRDFLIYQHAEVMLEKITLYAQASQARTLTIHGFAATKPVQVSRQGLAEDLALAEARANMVREALLRLGVAQDRLQVSWSGEPEPSDLEGGKLPESSKRRVTVTVTP